MRREMKAMRKWAACIAVVAIAAVAVAGCGSSSSSSSDKKSSASSQSTPDASAALGTPKKASGAPLVVGLINIENGPVTFPEYRQAAQAAVQYINNYKGGIGGRPVKLETCASDGQPATSARCAGQLADKK